MHRRFLQGIIWGWILVSGVPVAFAGAVPAASDTDAAEGLAFFERHIRPLLIERCHACHGVDRADGGLRLDSRERLLGGGASGPAVDLHDPASSGIVARATGGDADHRLDEAAVDLLMRWIGAGAPWPSALPSPGDPPILPDQSPERIERARATHWAFQPMSRAAAPPVRDVEWAGGSEIDRFVLASLEASGLTPSRRADPRTLLRRLYLDLIGLPPTYEEAARFEADSSPQAYEAVVDRLLADPRFGERWGRHWLDIARYADTKGYLAGSMSRTYPFAFTYRDYVIDSFNADKPYDRFVTEQIAADLMEDADRSSLAALGFLTLGRRFGGNQHDTIDDRIDVITRGLMALTVACARCHDHKYDPVPTADYYALYGIIRSTEEPGDLPVIAEAPAGPEVEAYERELAARQAAVDKYLGDLAVRVSDEMRSRAADYLVYIVRNLPKHRTERVSLNTERGQLRPGGVRRWEHHLVSRASGHDPVWSPLVKLADLEREGFAEAAAAYIATLTDDPAAPEPVNAAVLARLRAEPPSDIASVAAAYGELLERAHAEWKALIEAAGDGERPQALADPALEQLRLALYEPDTPTALTPLTVEQVKGQGEVNEINQLRGRITELQASSPGAPLRAMAVTASDRPFDPYVFRRGNPGNRGPTVPRRFLSVFDGIDDRSYDDTGRLQLAQAIVHPDNPLTARVMANRVWMHLFGTGIVASADDFGLRATPPTHPRLLDHLATSFIDGGWSVKGLIRSIVLSRTYQQASGDRADARGIDPTNALLWRQNRKRLEFEALRDASLAVSGRLDEQRGGRPVPLFDEPHINRRSIYGTINRQNLPGVLRTFDFPTPDASTSVRPQTTIPQQQLFMMNSRFLVMQAEALAERAASAAGAGADARALVTSVYRMALARDPVGDELALAVRFIDEVERAGVAGTVSAWRYGYGRYDTGSQRVVGFAPLPRFVEGRWQGGEGFPDPELHYLFLDGAGGHVGIDQEHAAVRRWIAPMDGAVRITGTLEHKATEGDGVRGRIVSDTGGLLGEWLVHNSSGTTEIDRVDVAKGQTIDFIVDCRSGHGWDSFGWSPLIEVVGGAGSGVVGRWDAAADFAAEPGTGERSGLEQLSQVLLMSNEFAYID